MTSGARFVDLSNRDLGRAAQVLVYRHGDAALAQADARYQALSEQAASAAPLWRRLRDYLAEARHDDRQWRALRENARPDAVIALSGSHNEPIDSSA